MPIVLDCNVVRNLGEGEIDSSGLVAASREGDTVHLADGAVAELVVQLIDGRFGWPKWLRARGTLARILDRREPVLLGGREGLSRAGIVAPGHILQVSGAEISDALNLMAAGWALLFRAKEPAELARRGVRMGGERIAFDFKAARKKVESFKQEWAEGFERTFVKILDRLPDVQALVPERGDARRWIHDACRLIGEDLNRGSEDAIASPATRLDAMIRVYVLLGLRHLRAKQRYNPRKHSNDSFDYDLLRYLAYPAAVCTSDGGVAKDLAAASGWQLQWVVQPEDLCAAEVRERLRTLEWPFDARPPSGAAGTCSQREPLK